VPHARDSGVFVSLGSDRDYPDAAPVSIPRSAGKVGDLDIVPRGMGVASLGRDLELLPLVFKSPIASERKLSDEMRPIESFNGACVGHTLSVSAPSLPTGGSQAVVRAKWKPR
jgi:hypothetical protein